MIPSKWVYFAPALKAPMKAPSKSLEASELDGLSYPLYGSPKLDGLRAVGLGTSLLSKTLSPFRNRHMQDVVAASGLLHGLDAELVAGSPVGDDVLRRSYSAFMSADGVPDWHLHVFDKWDAPGGFTSRHSKAQEAVSLAASKIGPRVKVLPHYRCDSPDDVLRLEEHVLADGYEGLMLRSADGTYEQRRCTRHQALLLKLKRFIERDAVLLYVEEARRNDNAAEELSDGSKRRGRSVAGRLEGTGFAGCVVGVDVDSGEEVRASTARLTAEERRQLLEDADALALAGGLFVYRRFGSTGAPRFPVFHSFAVGGEK